MKAWKFISLFFLLLNGSAMAQQGTGITANGQVYLPSGRPARQEIRLYVEMESARRAPFHVYTDLLGRFELRDMRTLVNYRITVETDDQTWGTTTMNFMPSGQNPRVDVFLQPLRRGPRTSNAPDSVSVNTLQQRVPPEARKEFEAALPDIRKNDYAKARPRLEKAVELFPQYLDARNELAVALMRENKLADAEKHLLIALHVDPVAIRPLMNLGLCLSRQERFADALPVLERATQLQPADASARLLLGVALIKTGKDQEGEAALLKAYGLGGKRVALAQYYLADLYQQRKEYARAAEALETYLRDHPEDSSAARIRKRIDQLRAAPASP